MTPVCSRLLHCVRNDRFVHKNKKRLLLWMGGKALFGVSVKPFSVVAAVAVVIAAKGVVQGF